MRFLLPAVLLALPFPWDAAGSGERSPAPVLAELFTSQACSSCPPAEALFADLAEDEGVIALEWHVTYWDDLRTREGVWADPFSDPAFTERQRAYNQALRGTRGVYTPQAVVGGASEAVGSRRRAVRDLIDAARPAPGAALFVARTGTGLEVAATGVGGDGAELWVAVFDREAATDVVRGENAGRALRSRNVVRSAARLALRDGRAALPLPGEGQGCAVWLQAPGQGPVLAAAYCPES